MRILDIGDLVNCLPPEIRQDVVGHTDDDTLWNIVQAGVHLSDDATVALRIRYRMQIRQTFDDTVVAFHETLPVTPAGLGQFHIPPVYDDETDDITRIIEHDLLDRFNSLVGLGLNVRAYNREGWQLLGLAISFRSDDIFDFLVDRLNPNDLFGYAHVGFNAPKYLSLCAQSGNPYAFERLVNRLQIDNFQEPRFARQLSGLAIYEMCRVFPVKTVRWACDKDLGLQNGSNPDSNGNVWHAGVTRGEPDFVDLLNDHVNNLINNVDIDGYTALFDAVDLEAAVGHGTEAERTVIRKLLEFGADVHAATQNGLTAVHVAMMVPGPSLEIVRALLERFDIHTSAGTNIGTVLHGIVNGLEEAIDQRASFMLRPDEAWLREDAMDRCRMVLEYGPDLEAENTVGQTPSERAEWYGFTELAALMKP